VAKLPTTASSAKSATGDHHLPGKSTAFTEDVGTVGRQGSSNPDDAIGVRQTDENRDTRRFKGVEFEMLQTKNKAGEAPVHAESELTTTYGPRQTRSQPRRQQRIDSFDVTADNKDAPSPTSSVSRGQLPPPAGSDNTSPRSPSPQALPMTLENFIADFTSATPRNSPTKLHTPNPPQILDSRDSTPHLHVSQTDAKFRPLPLTLPLRSKLLPGGHYRDSNLMPVPVNPARPNPAVEPGRVWLSSLASSSRPVEPWFPAKRWTCCQCGPLDPRGLAGLTIVEQRVCSRLECGHVRCGRGCVIIPDVGFSPY
jgi:hypothetical protein